MVTSTNRPTDRPTNRQGEYRAICLFRKLENRKKAEICNFNSFSDKNKKMSENGEIYTASKNFTLPPAVTALTNFTPAL